MKKIIAVCCVVSILLPGFLCAATTDTGWGIALKQLHKDQDVAILMSDGKLLKGEVLKVEKDDLFVIDTLLYKLHREDVSEIRIKKGASRKTGALIGLGLGVGAGIVMGILASGMCDSGYDCNDMETLPLMGGAMGLGLGLAFSSDTFEWKTIYRVVRAEEERRTSDWQDIFQRTQSEDSTSGEWHLEPE